MPLKIGFVGTGGIARTHIDALSKLDNAHITAFCDVNEERAREAAGRFNAKAYTDFQLMFAQEPLDAVYICVPPHAHIGAEEAAAERGIHVFVEKPVARTLERAKAIQSALMKSGVLNAVGYHFRYYAVTERALERLQGLKIGLVTGCWNGGMPGVDWWRRHELSGGQIVEQTTHIFDLARYLAGDITEVSAYFAQREMHLNHYPDSNVADVGVVSMKFASGAVGSMVNTCLMSASGKAGLEVITPDRTIELSWNYMKETERNRTEELWIHDNPYYNESKLFLEAIQKKDQSLIRTPYDDAVKTLAVTLAADEAATTGKPVTIQV